MLRKSRDAAAAPRSFTRHEVANGIQAILATNVFKTQVFGIV